MLSLEQLSDLYTAHAEAGRRPVRSFSVGGRHFDFNRRPAVMGVVNLSPQSWYRESVCLTLEMAHRRCARLAAEGVDLIDVGAESTLPHAARADLEAQKQKLLPIIRNLAASGHRLSVETYHPEVARLTLEAGASAINLTGPENAAEIYRIAARHNAAVIICFVAGNNVREVNAYPLESDPIPPLIEFFRRELDLADRCGLQNIFIDPGLGFYYRNLPDGANRVRLQANIFLHSIRLRSLGVPVCQALPHAFEFFHEEVRCAEPFFAVFAALGQAGLLRTHEVARVNAVLDTLAVCNAQPHRPPQTNPAESSPAAPNHSP